VQLERAVQDVLHRDALDPADRSSDPRTMGCVDARQRDVADLHSLLDAHEVDRSEHRARLADDGCHLRERPRPLREANAHDDAVRRRRLHDRRPLRRPRGHVLRERGRTSAVLGHHISYRFMRHMPLARDITLAHALSLRIHGHSAADLREVRARDARRFDGLAIRAVAAVTSLEWVRWQFGIVTVFRRACRAGGRQRERKGHAGPACSFAFATPMPRM